MHFGQMEAADANRLEARSIDRLEKSAVVRDEIGLPGGDRTPDNLLRRQVLYPTELRADSG